MPWHNKQNLFQIWRNNGSRLPFAAWLDSWHRDRYVVVEEIEVRSWPYGIARGYPTENGVPSDIYNYDRDWKLQRIIPNAGVYRWEHVPVRLENNIYMKDDSALAGIALTKSARMLDGDGVVRFGKFSGQSLSTIIEKDPSYFNWMVLNVNSFLVNPAYFQLLIESGVVKHEEVVIANEYKVRVYHERRDERRCKPAGPADGPT